MDTQLVAEMLNARRRAQLWAATIPKCAMCVEIGPRTTKYLHPTKGWRTVSNRRLGIPDQAEAA